MPWEVVPCEKRRDSIYELDENGKAYDNIYELRKVRKLVQRLLHVCSLCAGKPLQRTCYF